MSEGVAPETQPVRKNFPGATLPDEAVARSRIFNIFSKGILTFLVAAAFSSAIYRLLSGVAEVLALCIELIGAACLKESQRPVRMAATKRKMKLVLIRSFNSLYVQ